MAHRVCAWVWEVFSSSSVLSSPSGAPDSHGKGDYSLGSASPSLAPPPGHSYSNHKKQLQSTLHHQPCSFMCGACYFLMSSQPGPTSRSYFMFETHLGSCTLCYSQSLFWKRLGPLPRNFRTPLYGYSSSRYFLTAATMWFFVFGVFLISLFKFYISFLFF